MTLRASFAPACSRPLACGRFARLRPRPVPGPVSCRLRCSFSLRLGLRRFGFYRALSVALDPPCISLSLSAFVVLGLLGAWGLTALLTSLQSPLLFLFFSVLVSFFTPRRWEKGKPSGFPVGPCQCLTLAGPPQVGCTILALLGLRSLTSHGRLWRFSINLEFFLRWAVVPH